VSPGLDAAQSRAFGTRFGLVGEGRHLVTLPLYQPAALYFALLALHGGQDLVLMGQWSPRAALDRLRDDAVTTAFMVPSMFASLLAVPGATGETFPGLRAVVHATAACPVDVKRAMLDWWGPVLYDCYSPTEVLGTYALPDEWLARPGTVGKPLPGGEVVVRDEDGRECAPGEEGLVFLRDAGFTYADGSQPLARDRGFVAVGDVGYLDDEGWLFLTGRMTDYVSVGGSKFHPASVEEVLAAVEGVAECALTTLPDARLGQVPVALVVPAAGIDPGELRAAVLAHARGGLPRERVPLKVVVVPSLPRDGYGKLRRRELPALVLPQKQ
jgi:long-chain acyl-CoA synthetase